MANWIVYIHIVPNGKVYIGITGRDIKQRWKNNGLGYLNHKYFMNAIRKYGWDNIEHKILFTNLTEAEAKLKEIELIALYRSNEKEFGYNMTLGGDGRKGHMSERQKNLISIANRGKNAQLCADVVVKIKNDFLNNININEIQKKYNVSKDVLYCILSGKNYKYIMPEFISLWNEIKKQKKYNRLILENKIIDLVKLGYTAPEITVKLDNVSINMIYNLIRKYSIKTRESQIKNESKELKKLVCEEYKNGVSKDDLIKKYNLSNRKFMNYTQGIFTELKKIEDNKLKEEMCFLRKNGWMVKDIAKKYGCHREKVSNLTKDFAMELKMVDVNKVYELKDKGLNNREISKLINRDIDFVENWLKRRV